MIRDKTKYVIPALCGAILTFVPGGCCCLLAPFGGFAAASTLSTLTRDEEIEFEDALIVGALSGLLYSIFSTIINVLLIAWLAPFLGVGLGMLIAASSGPLALLGNDVVSRYLTSVAVQISFSTFLSMAIGAFGGAIASLSGAASSGGRRSAVQVDYQNESWDPKDWDK